MAKLIVYTDVTQTYGTAIMTRTAQKTKLFDALLERGLADSVSMAKALIMAGKVVVNEQRAEKAGQLVSPECSIRVKGADKYVSRGGQKLAYALEDFGLNDLNNISALDVGASTGGFTHCMLLAGAQKVYALDVGTNQLAWKLRQDPRVISMEKTDIRKVPGPIDPDISLVVADISFNSLRNLLPSLLQAAPAKGVKFLLLIKPQFELDSFLIPTGGVVVSDEHRQMAADRVTQALEELKIKDFEVKDCRLPGRTGNREIFVLFSV